MSYNSCFINFFVWPLLQGAPLLIEAGGDQEPPGNTWRYPMGSKIFLLILNHKRNPLFYCCSRICFQIPVFELCKIWIKKLNNYSTTEWFSAKRHKVKHRKSWKLLNWDQLQSDFPSLWMGISSWEVHNIIGKGQTNLMICAKPKLSQRSAQTPWSNPNGNFRLYI